MYKQNVDINSLLVTIQDMQASNKEFHEFSIFLSDKSV